MNRLKLLLLALMVLLPVSAVAADMPAKTASAATTPAGYPGPNASGFYLDLGTFASMSSSTVNSGTQSVNLNSTGGALEAGIGWQYKIPSDWAFTEVNVNWTNIGSSATVAISNGVASATIKSPWGFGIEQGFGFNWTYPFSLIPAVSNLFNGNTPTGLLPPGVAPTSSIPYVSVRANFDNVTGTINGIGSGSNWEVAPEFRLGLVNYLPNAGGGVLKTYVGYEFGDASVSIGGIGAAKPGNTIKAGLSYAF